MCDAPLLQFLATHLGLPGYAQCPALRVLNADSHDRVSLPLADAAVAVSQGLPPGVAPEQAVGGWDPNAMAAAQQALPPPQQADGQSPGPQQQQPESFKSCPQCQEVRSTTQFRIVAGSPDGYSILCRVCEEVRSPTPLRPP